MTTENEKASPVDTTPHFRAMAQRLVDAYHRDFSAYGYEPGEATCIAMEYLKLTARPEARVWTEVKDRLPPELTEVLIDHIIDDHKHTIDIAWQKGGEWTFPWIGRLAKAECAPVWVVRWTPLPALPQRGST